MTKSAKVEVRCEPAEKEAWQATAGDKRLSEWLRGLANAAASEHATLELLRAASPPPGPHAAVVANPRVPRVTPSRAPIERRPFRPDFK